MGRSWKILLLVCISGGLLLQAAPCADSTGDIVERLRQAQKLKDQSAVDAAAKELISKLGDAAGTPDTPDKFIAVPKVESALSKAEHAKAFFEALKAMEKNFFWRKKPDPTTMDAALRQPAAVITGVLAVRRSNAGGEKELLHLAIEAGDYLLGVQKDADRGLFPFPASTGKTKREFSVADKFLKKAGPRAADIIVNGWIVDDLGGGDLQFDNGLCGSALLDLYEATKEEKYKTAALAAAAWALQQPAVPNVNYNCFSILLLTKAYRATGEAKYLECAKEKARLSVYPLQLREGAHKGRWADGHNALPCYHYIIVRGLGALLAALPESDADLKQAQESLTLALEARNADFVKRGIIDSNNATDALCRIALEIPAARLPDGGRKAALDALRYCAEEAISRRRPPLTPDAWGLLLEVISRESAPSAR